MKPKLFFLLVRVKVFAFLRFCARADHCLSCLETWSRSDIFELLLSHPKQKFVPEIPPELATASLPGKDEGRTRSWEGIAQMNAGRNGAAH
jgi:hypothetical protein